MQQIQDFTIFGRQTAYAIAVDIATVVLGVIQIPIVTKTLGTSQYGIWALIITAISLITPFAMFSFNASIVRFLAVEKDINRIREDYFSAFLLVLLSGSIFSLLFFLISDFLAKYFLKDMSLSHYLKLSSLLILLNSVFPVVLAYFRRGSRIGIFNLLSFGSSAFQIGSIILFISLGYGLTGVIWASILSLSIIDIVGVLIIFKEIGFSLPKFANTKTYLKWGIPLTPNSAIQWIISVSDRYVISSFLGVSAAGIYNAADSLGSYASFALYPIGIVLYPIISKAYDEGKSDECRVYLQYSFKYLMMLTIPAVFGLTVLAKVLLRTLTTPQFFSGISIVGLAALGALISCIYAICNNIIHLVGKTQLTVRILSIAAISNIMLNIILVPRMGIIGAELASVVAYIVLGSITLVVTTRYIKFDLSISFIIKSVLSSGFMALCILLINPRSIIMVFVSIVSGTIAYFGFLIFIKGFTKTELAFFRLFVENNVKSIISKKHKT
jgi:O-antigen/teichoic acid export membrane protein